MNIIDIITKKKNKEELTEEEKKIHLEFSNKFYGNNFDSKLYKTIFINNKQQKIKPNGKQ